jgi:type I restriction enzyme S subunit
MPRLGTEAGRAAPFVLAPLPEQKRIADKLDSVLARVDACRDRLGRLPALLKRFRQSILAAATSGKLTEDWREANLAEQGWNATKLENLCTSVFDGPFGSNLKSDDYTSSGVRVVRLENIGHLYFEASKETYISDEKYQGLAKHSLQPDDILFSSFVDEEVRVCLYPAKLTTAAINKADCFCLRPDASKCIPSYLSYRLASRATYVELKELVHGATRPRINLKQLRQYLVEVPELQEQTEIVRRAEIIFAFADRLEARLATARRQVGQLTPALLAKAFRGELVALDPADEPAAELLKRLAAQREAAPKAKRTRAKS